MKFYVAVQIGDKEPFSSNYTSLGKALEFCETVLTTLGTRRRQIADFRKDALTKSWRTINFFDDDVLLQLGRL